MISPSTPGSPPSADSPLKGVLVGNATARIARTAPVRNRVIPISAVRVAIVLPPYSVIEMLGPRGVRFVASWAAAVTRLALAAVRLPPRDTTATIRTAPSPLRGSSRAARFQPKPRIARQPVRPGDPPRARASRPAGAHQIPRRWTADPDCGASGAQASPRRNTGLIRPSRGTLRLARSVWATVNPSLVSAIPCVCYCPRSPLAWCLLLAAIEDLEVSRRCVKT